MKLSRLTKAVAWGFGVGVFFSGFWYVPMFSDSRPMLMAEQSRSVVIISEVWTGLLVFIGTGVLTAFVVYYRPSKKG